ncbi:MAG: hypothetical protein IJO57_05420 [Bacilli bacterium]|nr:hypothetical protein [Bacilli bacterium]
MKKNLFIILLGLFALTSVGLGIYCIKLNTEIDELKSNDKITNNDVENDNVEQIALDCSFTRTYKIIDLMDEYRAAAPERSFIIVDQFQFFVPVVHSIPTKLKESLKVGQYYEFTYHIKGKMDSSKELEMIDVVGMIVEEHPNNDNLTATLQIKKTDKLGLDQTQEPICKTSK